MRQRALWLVFGDRKYLSEIEIDASRALQLRYRGENWPAFHSFWPGYHPWPFAAEEADFFLTVMEQARQFSLVCRDDPAVSNSLGAGSGQVLVRTLVDGVWQSRWSELPRVVERRFPIIDPTADMVGL